MSMVEKIAQALYGKFFCGDWPPKNEPDLGMGADDWRDAARLAIKIMREPTVTMAIAGGLSTGGFISAWEAMIDKALEE